MFFAAFQYAADILQKYRFVVPGNRVLALFGRIGRIQILKLLRGNKFDLGIDHGLKRREHCAGCKLRRRDYAHDHLYRIFKVFARPVFLIDYLFPVPLIHVYAVKIIRILVAPDRVHIGIQSLMHSETVIP